MHDDSCLRILDIDFALIDDNSLAGCRLVEAENQPSDPMGCARIELGSVEGVLVLAGRRP